MSIKSFLIGAPKATAAEIHERLPKKAALAVFSSDAMSSSAYATEEILRHLALAGLIGTAAFRYAAPIAGLIVLLLVIVVFSYRQTIAAYSNGGGSYIVASDNLGKGCGLIAGASLLIDYILTVAVSISAGVFALSSLFPSLAPYAVELAVGAIILITWANLTGICESGFLFSLPTYLFLLTTLLMIAYGTFRWFTDDGITITPPSGPLAGPGDVILGPGYTGEPITWFLLMSSFASGCAALTGVEAISNGVPAFKQPEAQNARITLVWMAGLLLVMFLGITWLSGYGAEPRNEESVLSQVGRGVFGTGSMMHTILQFATAGILLLAANTAYADFPRLMSLMAQDRYLPRQFSSLGDRLVFSNGILLLSIFSVLLVILFKASTTNLIPLYAVGVFLSFTLSQSGMVRRWFRRKEPGWQRSALINGIGALTTFVVMWVIIIAKFKEGAWMVVLIPLLVVLSLAIHRHYLNVRKELALEAFTPPPPRRNTVIVPVRTLHSGVIRALRFAETIAPGNVTAVHFSMDEAQTEQLREDWAKWERTIPLDVRDSPYREVVRPLLDYLDEVDKRWDNDVIILVLPEYIPAKWWHHLLHNQTELMIKGALLFRENRIVVSVPHQLKE